MGTIDEEEDDEEAGSGKHDESDGGRCRLLDRLGDRSPVWARLIMVTMIQLVDDLDPKAGGPYFGYDRELPMVDDYVKHPNMRGRVTRRVFHFQHFEESELHFVELRIEVR